LTGENPFLEIQVHIPIPDLSRLTNTESLRLA
jgi:hypothetical protein